MRYALESGPRHVADGGDVAIQGHYEASFTAGGDTIERFLTDKGRAGLMRLIDAGVTSFTREQIDELTTPPSLEDLLAAMDAEGAEGG